MGIDKDVISGFFMDSAGLFYLKYKFICYLLYK